jgi:hypothetical protein
MADSHDSHGHVDPNAAPMHTDVQETFPVSAVVFCYVLAAITLIAGLVTGILVVND